MGKAYNAFSGLRNTFRADTDLIRAGRRFHRNFMIFDAKCVGIAIFCRDRFLYIGRKRIGGSDFSPDADLYDRTIFHARQIDRSGEEQSKDQKPGQKEDIHACFLHDESQLLFAYFPSILSYKNSKRNKENVNSIKYSRNRKKSLDTRDWVVYDKDTCSFQNYMRCKLKQDRFGVITNAEMEKDMSYTEGKKFDLVGIADQYIETGFGEDGILNSIKFKNDENFNFSYDVIDVMAKKCPDKLAMLHVSKDGRERYFTFRDIAKFTNMTANYFSYLGIKRGDKVMLVLKRHFQFWFSILALHKIGAIAIPATNLLTRKDFEYRFKAGEVDAVVCTADGDVSREVDKASRGNTTLKLKIMVGGARESWHCFNKDIQFFSANFTKPKDVPGGDDPMLMFFTSGTTSYPKITTHNYKYPLGHYITAKYWHQVDPDGIHFAISDTGWGKALWGKLYGQWICEAPIFTYDFDDFDAKKILQMIEKYKITTFCAPPTAYRVMVHLQLEKYDLSSLQNVTTAGEALNPKIYEKFKEKTGFDIMEGFGQTETTMLIGNIKGMTPRPGSMGKPSPLYEVAVMLSDGTIAKTGEEGEIVVKVSDGVPNGLFTGYYNDKEKTDSVWYDGYYHTGDTACMDSDGYLWYVGRVDDVIKSSGYRIGPFEIENEIMKLPYVLECAVTSVPDKLRGQAIKATIVLADGSEGDEHMKNDIVKYLKKNVASYKWPKIVDFAKELPKTISGKVRRAEIKAHDWSEEEGGKSDANEIPEVESTAEEKKED